MIIFESILTIFDLCFVFKVVEAIGKSDWGLKSNRDKQIKLVQIRETLYSSFASLKNAFRITSLAQLNS